MSAERQARLGRILTPVISIDYRSAVAGRRLAVTGGEEHVPEITHVSRRKREATMDFTTIGLAIGAMVVGILYMQRRRARLSREDEA